MRRVTRYPTRDPLDIPDYLRIPAAVRRAAWDKAPPVASSFVPVAVKAASLDIEAFRQQLEQDRRTARDNHFARLKAKKASVPVDHEVMRWDAGKNRFVTDPYYVRLRDEARAARLASSGVVETPATNHVARGLRKMLEASRPAAKSKAVDDLGARVIEHTAPDGQFDPARLRKFAEANGVWDDKYAALNNGLQRMTVVNRLRGKVGKGHKLVWPKS